MPSDLAASVGEKQSFPAEETADTVVPFRASAHRDQFRVDLNQLRRWLGGRARTSGFTGRVWKSPAITATLVAGLAKLKGSKV